MLEKKEKLKRYLLTLINIDTVRYLSSPIIKQHLEKEAYIIKKLDEKEIELLFSIINKIHHLDREISLMNDIQNVNRIDPVIERINFIFREILLKKKFTKITNSPLLQLSITMTALLSCQNEFEYNLRKIYLNLLDKHISSSQDMSDEYLNYLTILNKKIKFKYPNIWFQKGYSILEEYEKNNINTSYLHKKIEEVIKYLLKYTDQELEIDSIYAEAISLQIYLRSLLIILNNENELIPYENMYNTLEPNETIAKGIVRNAFIANYIDNYEYTLTKKENNL